MRTIILAAGRGSRMKRLTQGSPKCLCPLGGRPLLEWQLSALREGGVRDVTVVRGYNGEKIVGDFDTMYNPRWNESNMVVTLMTAHQWLEREPCLISYSDIVYHPDHVRALSAAQGDIVITYDVCWKDLWALRFEDPFDDAETFLQQHGVLIEIGGKTKDPAQIQGQYMGLLKLTPKGWNTVVQYLDGLPAEEVDRLDMTGLIRRLLQQGTEIRVVPVEGRWCEADHESDLELYEQQIERADAMAVVWSHDWRKEK